MAEEKTEQATPKRLRDAREKGQVARSQDVSAALTVMAMAVYFMIMAQDMLKAILDMCEASMLIMDRPFSEALGMMTSIALICILRVAGPLIGLVMGVALCANLAQVGVIFSLQAAMPKLENINPDKWFKKVFSVKNAFELLKTMLKVLVLGYVACMVFRDYLPSFFHIHQSDVGHLQSVLCYAARDLLLTAAGTFCVIAAVDWFFQKWQFNKQNMMSKDEVKREYKDTEGDPLIKSKRKQLYQEMSAQNQLANVRKARVVVTNPTHFAVALDYEKGRTPLPIILAKGQGDLARRIIQTAEEEGIPIMRNVALAHDLYEQGETNAYIPRELIGPVAEALRWALSLQR